MSCQATPPQITPKMEQNTAANYLTNRPPLVPAAYLELPLGNIQANGWLHEQLERMADGMTGNLDELYPSVVGQRNGWLGGDGDGWERGPYWIDGLLPLAYILEDEALKNKVQQWVDWTIENQAANGYLGPVPFSEAPGYEPGLQRGQRKDWWPKMVMLKVLQQYYNATQDERVIETLTKYFQYQLQELPNRPLDADTFWANRRGGDNLMVVQWLYNLTGDEFLLDLAKIIEAQTFPWDEVFLNPPNLQTQPKLGSYFSLKDYPFDTSEIKTVSLADMGSIHTVNLAQGLKQPALLYQNTGDGRYLQAIHQALQTLKKYHGQVQGMYGGDEPLHGANPVQGVEFCSVSEKMFSLETILKISGEMAIGDLLERIAYNALPTQASDDFMSRQYFQAANQVALREYSGVSFENHNHKGTDFVYGLLTGYPCCTTNMHQSWPKFVQNLFYGTPDGGVAALQYAPSTVELKVANNQIINIKETTGYPFREAINFEVKLQENVTFPFHLRIPAWAKKPIITVNGTPFKVSIDNQIAIVDRTWKDGDVLTLKLPMELRTSIWHEYSTAIERGPLVFALKVEANKKIKDRKDDYGPFTELLPKTPWNYGLLQKELQYLSQNIEVEERPWEGEYPWNLQQAPIVLKTTGIRLSEWKAQNGVPHLPAFWGNYTKYQQQDFEEITLVPYGCTELRISQFPSISIR
ncbi:MAG: glycoside hydrolase family 127 protein [Saprospiraceae bacterium]